MAAQPPQPQPIYTLESPTTGLFKDRGSRFLAYLHPAQGKQQVDAILKTIAQAHPDCRHLCYAYRLGATEYAADAGEPSGSAGAPILRALHSAGVNYAMCGVVRYFGGIKLGVPGLIAAYTAATQNALSSAHIIEYVEYAQCSFSFGYPHTSGVELTLARANASRIAESFTEICTFTVQVRKDVLPQLEAGLAPYVTSFRVLPPED